MSLLSLKFLFLFLPVVLLFRFIPNEKIKTFLLVIASFVFYYFADAKWLVVFVGFTLVTVLLGRSMARCSKKAQKALFICSVMMHVMSLIVFKNIGILHVLVKGDAGANALMPLGISYFTFKAISYLTDIYTQRAKLDDNLIYDVLYLSFFGQIQVGPLTRYNEMKAISNEKAEKQLLFDSFADGASRVVIGFSKKLILADSIGNVVDEIFRSPIGELSPLYAWLGAIGFSLQLYFDFAGCSDIAIGITKMLGYNAPENFDHPYMTETVSDFWRRWHISLGHWFRDYVYIPLGGSRATKKYQAFFALLITWILTGLWHGMSLAFVVWGVGYFLFIWLERKTKIAKGIQNRFLKNVYRIVVLLFVVIEWVIFRAESLTYAISYIGVMFGRHVSSLANVRAAILLKEQWIYFTVALLLCTPVVSKIEAIVEKRKVTWVLYEIIKVTVLIALFGVAISAIVCGQYRPFVYANF